MLSFDDALRLRQKKAEEERDRLEVGVWGKLLTKDSSKELGTGIYCGTTGSNHERYWLLLRGSEPPQLMREGSCNFERAELTGEESAPPHVGFRFNPQLGGICQKPTVFYRKASSTSLMKAPGAIVPVSNTVGREIASVDGKPYVAFVVNGQQENFYLLATPDNFLWR